MRKIKFIIDSDLENVALVGISIKNLCLFLCLSDTDACQIELCAVEAINNSIIYAYEGDILKKVEITLEYDNNAITLKVYDSGNSMDIKVLDKAVLAFLDDREDIDNIPENGRGLALIKEIMDKVEYSTKDGVNCLVMTKFVSID